MRLTRREFLSSSAAIAIAPPAAAQSGAGAARLAVTKPGHLQVNLPFLYRGNSYPFIDHMRTCDRIWDYREGTPTEDHYALIGENGYPTRMPSVAPGRGTGSYWTAITLFVIPTEDRWVVTYEGDGRNYQVQIGASDPNVVFKLASYRPNRIEYSLTSVSKPYGFGIVAQVFLQNINPANPVKNIRIFRKSREALARVNRIWEPEFLEMYGGWGALRMMQWQRANNSVQAKWENRTTPAMLSWYGNNLHPDAYLGAAKHAGNDYTFPIARGGDPSAWTQGMMVQVRPMDVPEFKSVTAMNRGYPCRLRVPGHGFSVGDTIFFQPGSMGHQQNVTPPSWSSSTAYRRGSTVTAGGKTWQSLVDSNVGRDPSADDGSRWLFINNNSLSETQGYLARIGFHTVVAIDGDDVSINMDSTNWSNYSGSGGIVAKEMRIKAGNLPFKRVCGLDGGMIYVNALANARAVNAVWSLVYDATIDAMLMSTSYDHGNVPVELLIDLCNNARSNPWFCLPMMADDEYWLRFATMVRDTLRPDLKAFFELSNEVWNGHYAQTGYAQHQAQLRWGNKLPSFRSGNYAGYNFAYYGWRFHGAMSIVSDVFTGQMHRVNRVMAEFSVHYATGSTTFTCRDRHRAEGTGVPAPPLTLADSMAIAPYIEAKRSVCANTQYVWQYVHGNAAQKAEALAWLDGVVRSQTHDTQFNLWNILNKLYPGWDAMRAYELANLGRNLQVIQYEGGLGFIPQVCTLNGPNPYNGVTIKTEDVTAFFIGYYQSAYAAAALRDSLNGAIAAGQSYPSVYPLTGVWGSGGMFGAMEPNEFGTKWPMFQTILTFNSTGFAQ